MFSTFKNAMPSVYITAYCNGNRLYYGYDFDCIDKACRKQVEENPGDIYYVKFADKTLISFYEHGKEPVYLRNSDSFLVKGSKHVNGKWFNHGRKRCFVQPVTTQDTILDAHYNERVRLLEEQQQSNEHSS